MHSHERLLVLIFFGFVRRRRLSLGQSGRCYHMVAGATSRTQPEVVDSVTDHVTTSNRMSANDAPMPYFLHCGGTPDLTSSSEGPPPPPRCCDVTRHSSRNPSVGTRDLLTLEVPSLTSHGGAGLRLLGSRDRPQRCSCPHLAVFPLLPPPPSRTCVTWSDAANQQLVDVHTPLKAADLSDEQRRKDAAV